MSSFAEEYDEEKKRREKNGMEWNGRKKWEKERYLYTERIIQ
jgi:hypothetical protein